MSMRDRTRNLDIEALRGVAILFVFFQHYIELMPLHSLAPQAFDLVSFWGGVDIFFVISGFLITSHLVQISHEGGTSRWMMFRGFLSRRVRRLFSAALFWLAISVLAYPYIETEGNGQTGVLISAIVGMLGFADLYWPACAHGLLSASVCAGDAVNPVYWSLSLEQQFYLVAGAAFLFGGRRWLVAVLIAICLLTFAIPWGGSWSWGWTVRPFSLTTGVCLALVGCGNGFLSKALSPFERAILCAAALAGLLAISSLWAVTTGVSMIAVAFAVTALSTFVVWLAVPGIMVTNLQLLRPLAFVGERSYSLYLSHVLTILSVRQAVKTSGLDLNRLSQAEIGGLLLLTLTVGLAVAHVSYKVIEHRFSGPNALFHPSNYR